MAVILQFPRSDATVEPNDEIVTMLEAALESARSGVVQSLILLTADGNAVPDCSMLLDRAAVPAMLGAMRVAERQVLDSLGILGEPMDL